MKRASPDKCRQTQVRSSAFEMPKSFCSLCGSSHEADNSEACEAFRGEGKTTTRSSIRSTKMAKKSAKEEVLELTHDGGSSGLEDRKKEVERVIEELRLEEEVAELEKEMERLMARKEKRRAPAVSNETEAGATAAMTVALPNDGTAGIVGTEANAAVPKAGYSGAGRSRNRSRGGRKKRSSSSSSSSRSESRRRRRKWALKRYTLNKKDVEKLNCYELICATAMWAVDIPDMTVKDCKAVMEHINFLGNRAMNNDFYDKTHVTYDGAVRKLAETEGFSAFAQGSNGASVIHYGNQNMRGNKVSGGYTQRRTPAPNGKRACYAWNGEQGCTRSDEECRFAHICSRCGMKGHKRPKCKD